MRVIAGAFKGRRLKAPTWEGLRPTSDKLRETVFNVLAPRIAGARLLDVYAGTGAVGIEAISRGAAHVTFVERDRRAVRLIEQNLAACGAEAADYTIEVGDAVTVLRRLASRPRAGEAAETNRTRARGSVQVPPGVDLIWLDPPYDLPNLGDVLEAAACLLDPAGLLILERATRRPPDVPGSLTLAREVKSGDSTLTFLTSSSNTP
jgi:16S rRNA (guanine(966)-N(2))-methyltransferase RsmD